MSELTIDRKTANDQSTIEKSDLQAKKEVAQSKKPFAADNYSIYDYLKSTPAILIATVSGLIATISFLIKILLINVIAFLFNSYSFKIELSLFSLSTFLEIILILLIVLFLSGIIHVSSL